MDSLPIIVMFVLLILVLGGLLAYIMTENIVSGTKEDIKQIGIDVKGIASTTAPVITTTSTPTTTQSIATTTPEEVDETRLDKCYESKEFLNGSLFSCGVNLKNAIDLTEKCTDKLLQCQTEKARLINPALCHLQ